MNVESLAPVVELPHVLCSDQFTRAALKRLFTQAALYQDALRMHPRDLQTAHKGCMVSLVFYEPSTRTRLSFSHAAKHLGMHVHETENAKEFSSAAKGESIEDTVRVLMGYGSDVIVMRHHDADGPAKAAAVSRVPIVNAGAGQGEHPTQALLDLYTIEKRMGRVSGLTIAIGGDLKYGRTARSLALMLRLYKPVKIVFVAPHQARMGDDVKEDLSRDGVQWTETEDVAEALSEADVVYWTRVQAERMSEAERLQYGSVADHYRIGLLQMERMKRESILMHPLPRVTEIDPNVDADPRACYFEQAHNGVPVRMALLTGIIDQGLFCP